MNKFNKRLLIAFIIALVFMGIGSGIAFAEFTSIEYGGEKTLTTEKTKMDTAIFEIENPKNEIEITIYTDSKDNIQLIPDDNLPKDNITIESIVNTNSSVSTSHNYSDERDSSDQIDLYTYFNNWGSVAQLKVILDDIKTENKIYDYNSNILEAKIYAHPDTIKNIILK